MTDKVFAARPDHVLRGGAQTDEVGQDIVAKGNDYLDRTVVDLTDPPWGNDEIGKKFAENYLETRSDLREAVSALIDAVSNAAKLTADSATNFQAAQNDAIDHLNTTRRRN
ncbi:hypothetical protein SAMN05216251_115125 [Actinacidiphila alni]|uniref:Uncharacterized protein n=1 Tax=Actinacidiphila alni TaxID=380248 RepID=A0A1I2IZ28_9ACTN|nr:hypothetical protein [Actinacidiphila alni]SFF47544.1 hypothetical protein SAMN05216251_115125 [Actinacidiphila alni]